MYIVSLTEDITLCLHFFLLPLMGCRYTRVVGVETPVLYIADVSTLRFFGYIEDDMLGRLLGHVLEVTEKEGRSVAVNLPTPLEQKVPV